MDQKTPLKKAQKQQQQQATSSSRFYDLPCESCEESRDSRTIERIWGTDHGVVAIFCKNIPCSIKKANPDSNCNSYNFNLKSFTIHNS